MNRLWCASLLVVSSVIVAAAMSGCSDDSSAAPPPGATNLTDGGAGTSDARNEDVFSVPDTSRPAVTCNTVDVASLTPGTVEAMIEEAPAATGGTLEDGTYVLVKSVMYTMPGATSPEAFMRSKLVLAGSSVQRAEQVLVGGDGVLTVSESYTATVTKLVIATSCPAGEADLEGAYSVTKTGPKTTLTVFRTNGLGITGWTYEKQ